MSDIREPAHPEHPAAPGDEGQPFESSPGNEVSPGNGVPPNGNVHHAASSDQEASHAPPSASAEAAGEVSPGNSTEDEPDEPMPGNSVEPRAAADAADDEESPEDSIGNRIDGGNARPQAQPQGQPRGAKPGKGPQQNRDRRKGGGGGGPQAQGGGQPGGGGGDRPRGQQQQAAASNDPNARRAFHIGDKVRAKIVSLGQAAVLVDLWGKERGVLDLREVAAPDAPPPHVGDGVDVVVIQDGTRGGNLVVTRDPTRAERAREMVAQAFNSNEPIEGLITGVNRGGLEVDLSGVRAFCPSSQIDVRVPPTVDPKSLVLTRQLFKITSLLEDGREAVVSRRSIVEQEVRAKAEEARANLKVGAVVKGVVVAVKEYGVFVDLGGIEGLIHISELSNNRGARPSDVAKVGEEIEARVLRISQGGQPVEQGGKHAPEAEADVPPAGAEAVAEGAEGQPAAAEGGPAKKDDKRGGKDNNKKQRRGRPENALPRVALSRRSLEPDPWADIQKRIPIGSVHTGKVARMQPFGAFVELLPGVDGLLHVSELGDGKRLEHPNEVLKEGETVHVKVDRVDRGAKRISLSLVPEGVTEEQLKTAITPRVGMIVQAKVAEHESFGFWAQIEGTIGKAGRGLVTPPESNQPRGTDLRRAYPIGTEIKAKITELDRGRPKLSIRAALQDEERQAYRAYQKEATSKSVSVSLADKLRAKLGVLPGSGR